MKAKSLVALKSKIFNPCRKLSLILKIFKFKKPLLIKRIWSRPSPNKAEKTWKKQITPLRGRPTKEMEHSSITDGGRDRLLFPSPLTKMEALGHEEVEGACRSFENYLVDMIVEEGKLKDLMDVEELLYCWKNLKCPVFINLVSRFYGELCKDLFAAEDDNDFNSTQCFSPQYHC